MLPDDPGFRALTRRISECAGVSLEAYKDKCLQRRIAVRMRACGVHTYADYQALLERTPDEYERLKDALTINVSRLFRNRETWDVVRTTVLPELLAARRGQLRVWSAGCAAGEEPYTLAILIAEAAAAAGRPEWLGRVRIDATDVDRVSLKRAAAGRYRKESFMEVPAELIDRYFRPVGDEYEVCESLRRRVNVRPVDLCREPPPEAHYDLIVCRNVVIYFDRPMQERLFGLFADTLAEGGYLVLGKVETLSGPARDRLLLVDPRERIYRGSA